MGLLRFLGAAQRADFAVQLLLAPLQPRQAPEHFPSRVEPAPPSIDQLSAGLVGGMVLHTDQHRHYGWLFAFVFRLVSCLVVKLTQRCIKHLLVVAGSP